MIRSSERIAQWCHEHRLWLFVALGVLYLLPLNGQWRVRPDGLQNAFVAQKALHPDTPIPVDLLAHDQLEALQPGLPWLMAFSFSLTGAAAPWPAVLLMWGLGLLGLVLTYQLFKRVAKPEHAAVLTLLVGVTENYLLFSFELLNEMPFMVGLLAFLLGLELVREKGHSFWWGLVLALVGLVAMALFRSVVITVVGAGVLTALWTIATSPQRGKLAWRFGLGALALGAVLLVARVFDPRLDHPFMLNRDEHDILLRLTRELPTMWSQLVNRNLPLLLGESLSEACIGLDVAWYAAGPIAILMLAVGLWTFRVRPMWGLLVFAITTQQLLWWVADRYFIVLLPMFVLGCWMLIGWLEQHWPGKRLRWLPAAGLIALWALPNLVVIGGLIVEQRQAPFQRIYRGDADKPGWLVAPHAFGRWASENLPKDAVILWPDAPVSGKTNGMIRHYAQLLAGRRVLDVDEITPEQSRQPMYIALPARDRSEWEKIMNLGEISELPMGAIPSGIDYPRNILSFTFRKPDARYDAPDATNQQEQNPSPDTN